MVGKRKLVGNVINITSYTIQYNSTKVLPSGPSGSSVVEEVRLIVEKAKIHACGYLKIIGESINPAFPTWVVIERIAVEVAEFKDVQLEGGILEKCSNIGFHEGNASESDEALKTLYKKYDVLIVYVFSYQNHLTLVVCPIELGVEVAQVGLVLSLCQRL